MHKILYKHKIYYRQGTGTLETCHRRILPTRINAEITIDGFPDTIYYIPNLKKEEMTRLNESTDKYNLSQVIADIYLKRSGTKEPVTWKFFGGD